MLCEPCNVDIYKCLKCSGDHIEFSKGDGTFISEITCCDDPDFDVICEPTRRHNGRNFTYGLFYAV